MSKGMALLGCGVLVAVMIFVVGGFVPDPTVSAALIAVVVLGLIGLAWGDSRRKANAEQRAADYANERFEALASAARSPDFRLEVRAASQVVLAGIVFFLGALFLGAGILSSDVAWALGGGIVSAAGALLFVRAVPAVGRPKLVLGRTGFSTPLTPLLPWSLVHGMDMDTVRSRGDDILFQRLTFFIPSLPEHLPRFGLFHRLLYPLRSSAGRQRLEVILRNPSEPAEAIYDLAMLYWEWATGRRNDVNPMTVFERLHPDAGSSAPSPAIAALRRDTEATLPDGPEKTQALTDLAELEAGERRLESYRAAVRAAWREKRKRALYGVFACPPIAVALVYLGFHWAFPVFVAAVWLLSIYVAFLEKEGSLPPVIHAAGMMATLERDPDAEGRVLQEYGRKKR